MIKKKKKDRKKNTAECVYSILCECGRCYIGETGRPPFVWIREHRHNLKQGLLEKSRLAQHAYEEGHRVSWDEAKILAIEGNIRYRKYKESAYKACANNPISQSSLQISPIAIPLMRKEVTTPTEDQEGG
jgi:hypothetical protein